MTSLQQTMSWHNYLKTSTYDNFGIAISNSEDRSLERIPNFLFQDRKGMRNRYLYIMEMANKKPKKPGIVEAVDLLMGIIDSGGYDDFLEVLQRNDWWIYVTPVSVNYDLKLEGMKKPALNILRADAIRSYEVQKEKIGKPDPMDHLNRCLKRARDEEMKAKYANKTSATASAIMSTILDENEIEGDEFSEDVVQTGTQLLEMGAAPQDVANTMIAIRDTPADTQIEIAPARNINEVKIYDRFGNEQTSRMTPIVLDDD